MTDGKKYILNTLEYMNKEQVNVLADFIKTLNRCTTKDDLIKFVWGKDAYKTVDCSFPIDLQKSIKEINPNFSSWAHCYEASNGSWGELKNVCEEAILKMTKTFQS